MTHYFRLLASAATAVTLALALISASGCGQSGLPRGAVKGHITIGGQPLGKGRILFLPIAPSKGPAVSATIVNGEYQLERREGPIAGANRVEVEADLNLGFAIDDEAAFARRGGRPLPPNPVPAEFNRNSKLVIEIKPREQNSLDISVPAAAHVAAGARF
ncbi:MAG: hypothetical protein L0211_15165 [Planctomycetaceae bacterium]|nr:hypothetical protein [Planctomycetaceae bacterium]